MRIALAQINTTVGDISGNQSRILQSLADARTAQADLVLLPELAVTGYPPEDLLLRPDFLRAASESVAAIARETAGITALVGAPTLDRDLSNACVVCTQGKVAAVYRKRYLPNYGVFDEHRYFRPSRELILLRLGQTLIGPTVCEDIWQPGPPATELALAGATVITNISASPFHLGKGHEREAMLATRARDNACWVVFANAVGAQDDLVFDGHSVVVSPDGETVARARAFEEELLIADIEPSTATARRLRDARRRGIARERSSLPDPPIVELGEQQSPAAAATPRLAGKVAELEEMRLALELGLSDYVAKNRFEDVVLGISGGIDSALTAALAADALGPERVVLVSMPSRYTSPGTRTDAQRVAENLGTRFFEIPVGPAVGAFDEALAA
ncbi:MAG: nitrilase-related carbon-nitrogen hydrolase, partial [Gaiellales bacterium]